MMRQSVKVRKGDIRLILKRSFPSYRGRKFQIEFTDKVWIHDTNWSGGTRTEYAFVRANGEDKMLTVGAPWDNSVEGTSHELPINVLVVAHRIFCGKDLGITIYAHPSYAPKWLIEGGN
jgi:hypothetical protein